MKKTFLIGAIAALSVMASASAAHIVISDANNATITSGVSTLTLTAAGGSTFSLTAAPAIGTSWGNQGGVSVLGNGTVTVAQSGGTDFSGFAVQNPDSRALVLANPATYAGFSGADVWKDNGVALTGGESVSTGPLTGVGGSIAYFNGGIDNTFTSTSAGGGTNLLYGTAGPVIPEPSSALLMALGGFALFFRRRK